MASYFIGGITPTFSDILYPFFLSFQIHLSAEARDISRTCLEERQLQLRLNCSDKVRAALLTRLLQPHEFVAKVASEARKFVKVESWWKNDGHETVL